jgi:hypothetical protein
LDPSRHCGSLIAAQEHDAPIFKRAGLIGSGTTPAFNRNAQSCAATCAGGVKTPSSLLLQFLPGFLVNRENLALTFGFRLAESAVVVAAICARETVARIGASQRRAFIPGRAVHASVSAHVS